MEAFNVDVNARQADYRNLPSDTVLVSKIFATIQGEGPLAGTPAVFVRMAGCNLGTKESCPFCDTQFFLSQGRVMTIRKVIEEAEQCRGKARLMVLTGGEPLMQPHIHRFVAEVLGQMNFYYVQVETNGYFWNNELNELKRDCESDENFFIVVSPKVNQRGIYPDLPENMPVDCLKVLVDADPASPYHKLPEYAKHIGSRRTWISPIMHYRKAPDPMNERVCFLDPDTPLDVERCRQNIAYASELAQQLRYRLSLQTHLFTGVE
jgi:7-carboxy-7-deazaguanine synthase